MGMNGVETYVDQLLAQKGIAADPAVMQEYRADLLMRVGERLNAEMIALVPEEQKGALNDLLDIDAESEVLREFFITYVPQYREVFDRTLTDFQASYLK